jgi:hypothetical protein
MQHLLASFPFCHLSCLPSFLFQLAPRPWEPQLLQVSLQLFKPPAFGEEQLLLSPSLFYVFT